MCYVAQVYATPCEWLCRERETAPVAAETTLQGGTCPAGCPDVPQRTSVGYGVGYGVGVKGEKTTSEDCCASEERAKEKAVSCEQEGVRGCSAAGWAVNSGEEEARATCKNRA